MSLFKKESPEQLIKNAERELRVFEATSMIRKEYGEDKETGMGNTLEATRLSLAIASVEEAAYGGELAALRVRFDNAKRELTNRGPQKMEDAG